MTDRELLEAAAKAAGIGPVLCYETRRNCLRIGHRDSYSLWRPLTDDGDALRLAVKLELNVEQDPNAVFISTIDRDLCESVKDDRLAATRRAIVRAAAACAPSS